MRSIPAWRLHPQGQSVGAEPLLAIRSTQQADALAWSPSPARPLAGLRVLDLTRVLAGPVATRFLAGFGADVLRIDPPEWDEPGVIPEVTLGKRCARLDLRKPSSQRTLVELLRGAHVLMHGYRPGAMEGLGLDAQRRQALSPGLIDVSLNAYGWSGPWRERRGFDSLVQMSSGIADAGMQWSGKDRPTPLPVQALDHATGYLLAAAAIRGLTHRFKTSQGSEARASLARTAHLLMSDPPGTVTGGRVNAAADDWSAAVERTDFGPAHRLLAPVHIANAPMRWDRPAARLGSSAAEW
jgi:crotonobetainyl-CoA:carnitine CoA-transferase CaiB-like acyl-CoA transferase